MSSVFRGHHQMFVCRRGALLVKRHFPSLETFAINCFVGFQKIPSIPPQRKLPVYTYYKKCTNIIYIYIHNIYIYIIYIHNIYIYVCICYS